MLKIEGVMLLIRDQRGSGFAGFGHAYLRTWERQ